VPDNPGQAREVALRLAEPLVHDRIVILTGPAAHSGRMAQFFADAGAHPISVELSPAPSEARARFAAYERALSEPSEATRRAFDIVDPDGAALIYAGSFTGIKQTCGRRVIGARTPAHLAAERKDNQRQLLGLASEIISLEDRLPPLTGPVVVQGIPRLGIAMAASHTYLIPYRIPERLANIARQLQRDCASAVFAKFDAGLPCTFYGLVTANAVSTVGPVRALVYWNRDTWRIHALGVLRPLPMAAELLASVRAAVDAVARRLREQTGYVGAFGVDGVVADHCYIIHEVNNRVCAGFSLLDELAPSAAPLSAIDLVIRECATFSDALDEPLKVLSSVLNADTRWAVRLWAGRNHVLPERTHHPNYTDWANEVCRRAAGPNLIDVTELGALA
jgi:hypothetical protein